MHAQVVAYTICQEAIETNATRSRSQMIVCLLDTSTGQTKTCGVLSPTNNAGFFVCLLVYL